MAKITSTVKGKKLDLTKLKLKNETVITVGNTRTNARGDKLDPKTSKVIQTRNQVKSQQYRLHTNVPVDRPVSQQPVKVLPTPQQGKKK